MDLKTELDRFNTDEKWAYACAFAVRTVDRLLLEPEAAAGIDDVLEALEAPTTPIALFPHINWLTNANTSSRDPSTRTRDEISQQILNNAWMRLLYAPFTNELGDHLTVYLDDVDRDPSRRAQWETLAAQTGIADDIFDLWVGLADDWDGTHAELTEAVAAARTSPT